MTRRHRKPETRSVSISGPSYARLAAEALRREVSITSLAEEYLSGDPELWQDEPVKAQREPRTTSRSAWIVAAGKVREQ